jgi:hypothetical protein
VTVLVEAFTFSNGTDYAKLCIREGSSVISGSYLVWNATAAGGRVSATFLITGVTAGSHTYKLGFSMSAGGAGGVSGGPAFGSVLMIVSDAALTGPGLARELDYVETETADTSITATTSATAETFITGNPVTYDGSTTVMLHFFAPYAQPDTGAAGRQLIGVLYDGSTELDKFIQMRTPASGLSLQSSLNGFIRFTPSAGVHTYSTRFYVTAGTGQVGAGSDYVAAFQRITEVVGTGGVPNDILPWHIPVPVEMKPDTTIGTWVLVNDITNNYANGGTRLTVASGPAQNDEVAWDVILAAGTWELTVHHRKSSNVGIYTCTIGSISAGTFDGYNASAARGENTLTGIVVPTAGKYRLKLKMATKNASSSGYVGNPQHISLRRTA